MFPYLIHADHMVLSLRYSYYINCLPDSYLQQHIPVLAICHACSALVPCPPLPTQWLWSRGWWWGVGRKRVGGWGGWVVGGGGVGGWGVVVGWVGGGGWWGGGGLPTTPSDNTNSLQALPHTSVKVESCGNKLILLEIYSQALLWCNRLWQSTVKPVYNDHPVGQANMVPQDRWSQTAGRHGSQPGTQNRLCCRHSWQLTHIWL